MKRQIIFKGASEVLPPAAALDPGSSAYPWFNTPSKKLWEVWNNLVPVPGVDHSEEGQYAYCWPSTPTAWWSPLQIAQGMEKAPTLVRINKVTITTGFDYSQQGPNGWWFEDSPPCAHGPECAIILRKRDLTTYQKGTGAAAHTIALAEAATYNVNISTHPDEFKLYPLTWELLAHPEGGPWTLEDVSNLVVGVEFGFSNGPNGKAFDETTGSFHKIRAPILTVTLDVEDIGGSVEGPRFASSLTLRLMRRARNAIRPVTFADRSVGELGQRAYLSHPRGPGVGGAGWRRGWGRPRLERRGGLVLKRTYYPESFQIADEVLDLDPFACLGWAAYRIDSAWSPELQGLALLDKGKGFTHVRAQDSWSPRPGDGVLMRVLEDYPNLSPEGLAVAGGGDVSVCLRNWDLMQAGWSTVGAAGTFAAAADTTIHLAEEQGYLSSCKLTYGAGGGAGGRERSLGALAAGRLHVRVIVRNSSVVTPATQFGEWYLHGVASGWWDEANRAWSGVAVYNPIPSDEPSGESVADAIPAAADTYTVGVGRFSAQMGPVVLNAAIVDVQHSDTTVAGGRPALVTLGTAITRVADSHQMPHAWGRELWSHERGVAVVEVRPWWRAEDLPNGAVKPLLFALHAAGTYQTLQFVAVTGSDDLIRWESAISGEATFTLDCPVPVHLTRAHVLRAWCRWLGADGWREWGSYSVAVGYMVTLASTGAVVSTGSVLGRLVSETAVPYARDYVAIGCDPTRQLDGSVRLVETRRNPIGELECLWKI